MQVLRALAALMVVVHHAQYDAAALADRLSLSFSPSHLLPWLSGVDIFFVISGFVMVHASRPLFGTAGAWSTFLSRRIVRIVPLYWGVTTLYLAVAILLPQVLNSGWPGPWQIVASYLFIPAMRADGAVQPIYSLGWTLNFEMFFYLVFAAAIALPRRHAVLAVSLGLALLVASRPFIGWSLPVAYWSDPIILEFVLGMGVAMIRETGLRLGGAARIALVVAGFGLLHLDLAAADGTALPQFIGYGGPAALLVAAAVLGRPNTRPPAVERALVAMGDASYALYLLHPFVIRALREIFMRSPLGLWLGPWGFVAACVVAAILVAVLVYQRLEFPLHRFLRARLTSHR
ncbi:MAG: acyltransferase [Chelatococcus sp.]|nr:acyltransferase [Chelatococcus sp. YT9]MBX3558415.1 acyltransferase [Chelatococcus sp.]